MLVQATGEDVPPRVEFRNEYGVPKLDVLTVGLDCLCVVHHPISQSFDRGAARLSVFAGEIVRRAAWPTLEFHR
jgi:hypothetical protein